MQRIWAWPGATRMNQCRSTGPPPSILVFPHFNHTLFGQFFHTLEEFLGPCQITALARWGPCLPSNKASISFESPGTCPIRAATDGGFVRAFRHAVGLHRS